MKHSEITLIRGCNCCNYASYYEVVCPYCATFIEGGSVITHMVGEHIIKCKECDQAFIGEITVDIPVRLMIGYTTSVE